MVVLAILHNAFFVSCFCGNGAVLLWFLYLQLLVLAQFALVLVQLLVLAPCD